MNQQLHFRRLIYIDCWSDHMLAGTINVVRNRKIRLLSSPILKFGFKKEKKKIKLASSALRSPIYKSWLNLQNYRCIFWSVSVPKYVKFTNKRIHWRAFNEEFGKEYLNICTVNTMIIIKMGPMKWILKIRLRFKEWWHKPLTTCQLKV